MRRVAGVLLFIVFSVLINGQIIIDHNNTVLQNIPLSYIDLARNNLHIVFEHTSHGSQLIDGMTGLYNWKGSAYLWNNGGSGGALDIDDHGISGIAGSDLGSPDFTAWASSTRSYLNNPANSNVNVVMWAWCGQVSTATESQINTYLSLMTSLENDYPSVRFVYMTGHLDGTGTTGNLHIRNEQIRSYCRNNNKILYDFADIESYDPDGSYFLNKRANDNCDYDNNNDGVYDNNWAIQWQNNHTLNVDWYECTSAHSQPLNANRKAYAAWWLWARLAGWNGSSTVPVTGITLSGAGGVSVINTDNGTLQLSASVQPANATNKSVTWSLVNGTGQATISSSGLVTAISNGTVTARATANDGSGTYGTLNITITNQTQPVTAITVTGAGGLSTINIDNGSLQLTATVLPANATNKSVTWSLSNGTGQATISSTGLVTALTNGTVTARATANDGSGVFGILGISITNQVEPVTGITVSGTGGISTISTDNGTLQLIATILPVNATNKSVTWSLSNGTGQGTISSSGLVTAVTSGTVTARAMANDGSGVFGTFVITITNQFIPVTGITVTGPSVITTDNGTAQLSVTIAPANATNKSITWSLSNGTGQASITSGGLVTAISNGTVSARATANDGSGVYGTFTLTISNQTIHISSITVAGQGGANTITSDNGTLQLQATVYPANATNKTVTWSVAGGTGQADVSSTGLVTALANGTVVIQASANDGTGIYGQLIITLSNQIIPVEVISIKSEDGSTTITKEKGTLQLSAQVIPAVATVKDVSWTVVNITGQASISPTGLVTAIDDGIITVMASATDGSGVNGTLEITIRSKNSEPLVAYVADNELRIPLDESFTNCKISIYDLNGCLYSSKWVDSDIMVFNISSFRPGIYLIVLSKSEIIKTGKIILP